MGAFSIDSGWQWSCGLLTGCFCLSRAGVLVAGVLYVITHSVRPLANSAWIVRIRTVCVTYSESHVGGCLASALSFTQGHFGRTVKFASSVIYHWCINLGS